MSAIIRLGEHKWRLPPYPETQDDVLFYHESKADQYWRRDNNYPDFFFGYNPLTAANAQYTEWNDHDGSLISLGVDDTQELIRLRDRELRRRIDGIWFMNEGEPVHMTGDHYFQLQWGAMKGYTNPYDGSHFGEYREFQGDYQYFLQMCRQSTDDYGRRNCSASLLVKPKKTGITQLQALNFLNRSTYMKQRNFGIMSKTGDDVLDANFAYYLFAFDELPYIFRPSVQNRLTTEIVFGSPRVRQTGSRRSMLAQLEYKKGFNTKVFTKGNVPKPFDGPVMEEYWVDEWIKLENPYPKTILDTSKEVVKKQEVIHGLGHWTSYPGESDDRTFHEAKKIWQDSQLSTMNKVTGRTNTEFFAYHISAEESGESGFNRYGKPDRVKNRTYIMAKRKQLEKDPGELQAYTRQYSLTPEEAWREGGGGDTTYNNVRLGKHKDDLTIALRNGDLPYTEGKLEWVNGIRLGQVEIIPLSEEEKEQGVEAPCRFYLLDKLDKDSFNVPIRNNLRDGHGRLKPNDNTPYVGATDPTEFAPKKGLKTASQCASTIMTHPNPYLSSLYGIPMGKRLVFVYLARPDNPRDMYDDICKKILFFGCHELVEANRQWMTTMLIEDGLQNFLLVRNSKTKAIEPFNASDHQTLIRTTVAGATDVIDDIVRAKKNYYTKPKAEEPDYLELTEDERLIGQDMSFDPGNTKPSDLSMCHGLNILALYSFSAIMQRLKQRGERYNATEMQYIMEQLCH